MKIAFEVQPLYEKEKTGVGWHMYNIIFTITNKFPQYRFTLLSFEEIDKNNIPQSIQDLERKNCKIAFNEKIPWIYRKMLNKFGIKSLSTDSSNKKHDIYHFFNFTLPEKVPPGKTVLTVHDMVYKVFPETMSKANYKKLAENLEQSCRQANAIITCSNNSKREIVKYLNIPAEKIHVVYNAVDAKRFHNNYSHEEIRLTQKKYKLPEQYFLYLGTLEPRKNVTGLIEAYNELLKVGQKIPKLVVAGKKGWDYEDIFQKVKALYLHEFVFFPGYVEDADVPKLMKGATAFVFPSWYEGFGMPPLEAMACGVPVIASNTSALPEVVGDAGLLVDPFSVKEISEAMQALINNEELRNVLVQKGLNRAKAFTWEKAAEKVMQVYESLLDKR